MASSSARGASAARSSAGSSRARASRASAAPPPAALYDTLAERPVYVVVPSTVNLDALRAHLGKHLGHPYAFREISVDQGAFASGNVELCAPDSTCAVLGD
ncbi:hypothetical protein AMAG_03041 [Allomyces macrogynus ATCC 38327]|uniref:Uncharacterized protein n=1 Tax=Allomyces macrogynus (strain ATCC 38327) TaxID=578462 RepID=A0A0L0S435_ALLM3|nr:hypothetical protein AMAG_03041 [Allomyces macrogynus ATCC 38327]|eukprot:KNE57317.1 hypothetical protein AMAG_03041 [Allomyces macrogynus ATCC 38327]